MDDLYRYREAVDAYWPAVDRFFDDLPGDHYRRSRLLRQNLAATHSTTGSFHDILRRPDDHPLLHYHLWLLDDLDLHAGDRLPLEEYLFGAMVYSLCVTEVRRGVAVRDSFIDGSYAGLANSLSREAARQFDAVLKGDSPFWDDLRALADVAVDTEAKRLAPYALSGLAVFEAIGRSEQRSELRAMLGHLNAVFATRNDLLSIRRDLARGMITEPVGQMIDAAGTDPESSPEAVLGSLLLSGAVDSLAPEWRAHIEALADHADRLDLPTFERYADHLDGMMEATRSALRLPSDGTATAMAPRFESASTPLPEAIAAARRFLLADPTMREAWEVHRWGMAGAAEVTARFPAGLVIEVLGRHGNDVTDLVDDYYRQAAEKQFAYYDHPDLPYVETDTLGTMLRLYPYSKQTEWHRGVLDEYIDLLEAHAGSADRLPVWLTSGGEHVLLGEGCATIEANLLRGLIAYDSVRFADLAKRPAKRLLDDFVERGTGITVNYPRFYLLPVLAGLLVTLDDRAITETKGAWKRLAMQIEIETARERISPMTAACLSLACTYPRMTHLSDASWEAVILKGQTIDGGWAGEPMFFAPNRGGETTWYSSRLLTSAVCYDALNARSAMPSQ